MKKQNLEMVLFERGHSIITVKLMIEDCRNKMLKYLDDGEYSLAEKVCDEDFGLDSSYLFDLV